MDTLPLPERADVIEPGDTATRRAWNETEARALAAAEADLDAGFYVDADDMRAWVRSIGTDHERPPPATRRR